MDAQSVRDSWHSCCILVRHRQNDAAVFQSSRPKSHSVNHYSTEPKCVNISKTVQEILPKLLLIMTIVESCIFTIGIVDLGWRWTAISSNVRRISLGLEDLGGNNIHEILTVLSATEHCNPLNVLFNIMFLALICCIEFFSRRLHTRTAVARLP